MNYDEILKFDLDNNGFPRITKKNVKLINFIVKNDSNYRRDNDANDKTSTLNLVKNLKSNYNKNNLLEVIIAIDKQNSTHLSVSGKEKHNNKGRILTNDYLFQIPNLLTKIQNGDISLVDDIANNAIPNRYIISFASKFCSYVSRYLDYIDNFSIYDEVLAKILPYYYYEYTKKILSPKINRDSIKKKGYEWYNNIIDEIIKQVKLKEHYSITRKDFDYLLWYYFKGDKDIKDENDKKTITHYSRITIALSKIPKQ